MILYQASILGERERQRQRQTETEDRENDLAVLLCVPNTARWDKGCKKSRTIVLNP